MKIIKETKKLKLFSEKKDEETIFYREHKEEKDSLTPIYTIKNDNIIYKYQEKEIIFKNYKKLPKLINSYGYGFTNISVEYFFREIIKEVKTIFISKTKQSELKDKELILNENDLNTVISTINQEQRACNQTKKALLQNLFASKFPKLKYEYKTTNSNKNLILRNLNSKLIEKLNADEIEKIGNFYVSATKKYSRADLKERMLIDLQEKTKLITLQEVIKQYENLLSEEVT